MYTVYALFFCLLICAPYPYFRFGDDVWNSSVGIHKKMASGCLEKKELDGLRIVSEKDVPLSLCFLCNLLIWYKHC